MKQTDKNPGVRTKLFVANETIGIGKIKLLRLVGETGSISAAAAVVMGLFLIPALREDPPIMVAEPVVSDHTIDIESIESDGPLVMVMQENSDEPAIIWFVETDMETEG